MCHLDYISSTFSNTLNFLPILYYFVRIADMKKSYCLKLSKPNICFEYHQGEYIQGIGIIGI